LEVRLKIEEITLDGYIHISFNQELITPPFDEFLDYNPLSEKVYVIYNYTGEDPFAWGMQEIGLLKNS